MPVLGNFYQSSEKLNYYPDSELYGNFKIDAFRFFIKMDNFTDLIKKEANFQITNYPIYDFKLRLGVNWILKD